MLLLLLASGADSSVRPAGRDDAFDAATAVLNIRAANSIRDAAFSLPE
jgi:hypothetical protein